MKDTLVVQDFLNVFPDSVMGLALERKLELSIELALGTTWIFKVPYKMALIELQELKK